ncbi:MAG TPA: hypothetical protein DIS98_10485 [Colwellia sp.]|nr:hypothetical protein [Colwellia sp.]
MTPLTGEDAYHYLVEKNYLYLKIVRKNNKFTFLYSEGGEQWSYLRSFSLTSTKAIKGRLIAQSPISKNIKLYILIFYLRNKTLKFLW